MDEPPWAWEVKRRGKTKSSLSTQRACATYTCTIPVLSPPSPHNYDTRMAYYFVTRTQVHVLCSSNVAESCLDPSSTFLFPLLLHYISSSARCQHTRLTLTTPANDHCKKYVNKNHGTQSCGCKCPFIDVYWKKGARPEKWYP